MSASAAESEFLRTKRRYEEDYRKKIALQLVAYPGATIGVEVELDPSENAFRAEAPSIGRTFSGEIFQVENVVLTVARFA